MGQLLRGWWVLLLLPALCVLLTIAIYLWNWGGGPRGPESELERYDLTSELQDVLRQHQQVPMISSAEASAWTDQSPSMPRLAEALEMQPDPIRAPMNELFDQAATAAGREEHFQATRTVPCFVWLVADSQDSASDANFLTRICYGGGRAPYTTATLAIKR